MRRQRGGVCARQQGPRDDVGCGTTVDCAFSAQRCSRLHGDGRDGRRGAHRGGGRSRHSHGGRPAGGGGARNRDRGRAHRARIARHYHDTYGVAVDPARVVVTTGSSGGFILAFLALFEPGDRVAVALPGYPPYRHILSALGCEPVAIETTQATRWAITPEMLMAAHRKAPLKGVLVASPANPTGTMMTAQALADLIAAAEGEGIRFISDEIYHGLDYAFVAQ